jgi:hypothetical protein
MKVSSLFLAIIKVLSVIQNKTEGAKIKLNQMGLKLTSFQVFLCKACNNLLPTKDNLFKKRMVWDRMCSMIRTIPV